MNSVTTSSSVNAGESKLYMKPRNGTNMKPLVLNTSDTKSAKAPICTKEPKLTFVDALTQIMEHAQEYVQWSNSGKSVMIRDLESFRVNVLPVYYRHSNVRSFMRQLNTYSFIKINRSMSEAIELGDPDLDPSKVMAFFHPNFTRDNPSCRSRIKRKGSVVRESSCEEGNSHENTTSLSIDSHSDTASNSRGTKRSMTSSTGVNGDYTIDDIINPMHKRHHSDPVRNRSCLYSDLLPPNLSTQFRPILPAVLSNDEVGLSDSPLNGLRDTRRRFDESRLHNEIVQGDLQQESSTFPIQSYILGGLSKQQQQQQLQQNQRISLNGQRKQNLNSYPLWLPSNNMGVNNDISNSSYDGLPYQYQQPMAGGKESPNWNVGSSTYHQSGWESHMDGLPDCISMHDISNDQGFRRSPLWGTSRDDWFADGAIRRPTDFLSNQARKIPYSCSSEVISHSYAERMNSYMSNSIDHRMKASIPFTNEDLVSSQLDTILNTGEDVDIDNSIFNQLNIRDDNGASSKNIVDAGEELLRELDSELLHKKD